ERPDGIFTVVGLVLSGCAGFDGVVAHSGGGNWNKYVRGPSTTRTVPADNVSSRSNHKTPPSCAPGNTVVPLRYDFPNVTVCPFCTSSSACASQRACAS